ncbi:MAG: Xaa-Pro aminopeptidase [Candidatus Sericytochromatia bacterium]|nr:Xaa-Pro aminopeptidase [Candidatus Sericytochromatia bacterium]
MFDQRRKKFVEQMGGGVAVFRSAPEYIRNNDAHYKYRQDSDFYYLTGFAEPNCVAVFAPEHPEHQYILFVRPRDPERETWDGKRAGVEGAVSQYGADIAYSIDEIDTILPKYIKNTDQLYYAIGNNPEFDPKIIDLIVSLRRKGRLGEFAPSTITDTGKIVHEMRLIKSSEEIELMKKANYVSFQAHIEAMKATKPGMYEFEVESVIDNQFKKHGANAPAYNSIVGTGANATILHYVENNAQLKDGDLLLIDAGAECDFYAGDITRTFPVNGKFTKAQKDVYEVVLESQLEAIKMVKPGTRFVDVHNRAVEVLTEGMVKIGLLKGNVQDLIKDETYKKFYMHKTGHWLGMDVHDVGKYFTNNSESRPLEAGMVLTVEPGLYINENTEGVPSEYLGIGIRIEDDILVTETGSYNLSAAVPKQVAEIESLMAR